MSVDRNSGALARIDRLGYASFWVIFFGLMGLITAFCLHIFPSTGLAGWAVMGASALTTGVGIWMGVMARIYRARWYGGRALFLCQK